MPIKGGMSVCAGFVRSAEKGVQIGHNWMAGWRGGGCQAGVGRRYCWGCKGRVVESFHARGQSAASAETPFPDLHGYHTITYILYIH